jgi:hypothetical protein
LFSLSPNPLEYTLMKYLYLQKMRSNTALQVTRCRAAPVVALRQRSPEFGRYAQ